MKCSKPAPFVLCIFDVNVCSLMLEILHMSAFSSHVNIVVTFYWSGVVALYHLYGMMLSTHQFNIYGY